MLESTTHQLGPHPREGMRFGPLVTKLQAVTDTTAGPACARAKTLCVSSHWTPMNVKTLRTRKRIRKRSYERAREENGRDRC